MKKYELLYIVPGQYTDAEVEGIRQKVIGLVEKINGQITRHENLGKIKLAYPINKVRHGTYILVHFDLADHDFSGLDREMRMDDEILRHQIIVAPKGAADRQYEISAYVPPLSEEARREFQNQTPANPRPATAPAPTSAAAPAPAPKSEPASSEERSEPVSPAKREPAAEPAAPAETLAPPPPAVKEESSLTVEELDKKLDEILEDDMSKSF